MKHKKGYKFLETMNEKKATEKQKFYIEINNLGDSNISFANAFALIRDHKKEIEKNLKRIKFLEESKKKDLIKKLKEIEFESFKTDKFLEDIKVKKASKQLKYYAKSKGLVFDENISMQELRELIDDLK